jgi:hypothetical protein
MDAYLWEWFLQAASCTEEEIPRYCICCWVEAYPDVPFPALWSSTLCPRHYAQTKQQYAARRTQPHPAE